MDDRDVEPVEDENDEREEPQPEGDGNETASGAKPEAEHVIMHDLLPTTVDLDIAYANTFRHAIDMTPTPLPLIKDLVSRGVSYLGICGTEFQTGFLISQLRDGLIRAIQDPTSPLQDLRFGTQTAEPIVIDAGSGGEPLVPPGGNDNEPLVPRVGKGRGGRKGKGRGSSGENGTPDPDGGKAGGRGRGRGDNEGRGAGRGSGDSVHVRDCFRGTTFFQ